jgi:hypothetical protein
MSVNLGMTRTHIARYPAARKWTVPTSTGSDALGVIDRKVASLNMRLTAAHADVADLVTRVRDAEAERECIAKNPALAPDATFVADVVHEVPAGVGG